MRRWRALTVGAVFVSVFLTAAQGLGAADLTFRTDSRGEYASYRLQKNETIWTHVVRRFTSRTDNVSDNESANRILDRSGFDNDRTIPDGAEIKIPVALLAPEFRKGASATTAARGPLAGVVVILDAGHGGIDPGATPTRGIYENEIVYDIMCRAKRILENETGATVYVTIRDASRGFATTAKRSGFPGDSDEYILAHPTYRIVKTVVALHLRWYLSNSLYSAARHRGVESDRVLFTSFHADFLARNLRGTTVYIPGAAYRKGKYGKHGREYRRFAEVRERPDVAFTASDRARSEALSEAFAEQLTTALRASRVKVFGNKPIRNHITRDGGWEFVPAVLRYNAVPTSVLVECGNLNNARDRQNLCNPTFRERFARAYVNAVIAHMRTR